MPYVYASEELRDELDKTVKQYDRDMTKTAILEEALEMWREEHLDDDMTSGVIVNGS